MNTVCTATAGLRRLSDNHAQLLTQAQAFEGLPEGVTRFDLLRHLKRAAPHYALRPALLCFIEHLIVRTSECDWQGYGAPIAWPSNDELMATLGLGRTAIKELVRIAQRVGLVVMRDSENGKRYGQRDKRGVILYAYGFDLSPLAERYEEFVATGDALQLQRQQLRHLRKSITADRREIRRLTADALETGLAGFDWLAALEEARHRDTRDYELARLQALADHTRETRQAVERAWLDAHGTVENAPTGAENRPHYIPTTEPLIVKTTEYGARREGVVEEAVESLLDEATASAAERISAELIMDALPELSTFMSCEPDTAKWADIHAAAEAARHVLGVHPTLWAKAVKALGVNNASAAMGYTLANHIDGRLRGTPGGYFWALVERARSGQLRLRDSLWGKLGRPKCAAAKEAHLARRRARMH